MPEFTFIYSETAVQDVIKIEKLCSYLLEIRAYPFSRVCFAQVALAGGDVIPEKRGSVRCGWMWPGRRQAGLVNGDDGN